MMTGFSALSQEFSVIGLLDQDISYGKKPFDKTFKLLLNEEEKAMQHY